PLAKAARQRADAAAGDGVEAGAGDRAVDRRASCDRGDVAHARHEVEGRVDRHVGMPGRRLGDVAETPARRDPASCEAEAVDACLTGVGGEHAGEDAERRRLAGAVRAEETRDLAARDVQRDAVDGGAPAEALGELPRLDQATAARAGAVVAGAGRRVRNAGRTTLIQAGTSTSPPKVLKTMRSARRSPISAWNLRSENHQKIVPASMVVAV